MEDPKSISSEEELVELRNEGKITEGEYQELLAAVRKSSPSVPEGPVSVSRKHIFRVGLAAIIVTATALLIVATVTVGGRRIDLVAAKDSFGIRPYSEGGLHYAVLSILNTGNTASPEFRFYFYGGHLAESEPVDHGAGPIEAGGIWNAASAPFALKEGVNELIVVLDPQNRIKESDETNNRVSLRVVVDEGHIIETNVNGAIGE